MRMVPLLGVRHVLHHILYMVAHLSHILAYKFQLCRDVTKMTTQNTAMCV